MLKLYMTYTLILEELNVLIRGGHDFRGKNDARQAEAG